MLSAPPLRNDAQGYPYDGVGGTRAVTDGRTMQAADAVEPYSNRHENSPADNRSPDNAMLLLWNPTTGTTVGIP